MYWNRIDLHQHTDHDIDCHGSHVENNYTHEDYYKWLLEEKVKLKAVTCHNNINLSSHIKHAIISDILGINHLVGVEIDYKFDSLEFHAITILSPSVDVIDFSNRLDKLRESKGNNIYFDKEDFCKLHSNIEFIFIPHAIKDKGILEQKVGELEKSTLDWVVKSLISGIGEPILFENTREYHIYSVIEKIHRTLKLDNVEVEIASYIGDDYKFDNDEMRKEKIKNKPKYSINSQPTYRGLEIALRNPNSRLSLDSQIINRERFIKKVSILENDAFENSEITFSPGLNVIIGNSGSGKTLLLNEIFFEIKGDNLKAAMKDNSKKSGNQYKGKVGNEKILNIDYDSPINESDLKILEIPNIYSEILKTQNEKDSEIQNMFGINNITDVNKLISDYKLKIDEYIKKIQVCKSSREIGFQNFTNIRSAIDFLEKNKLEVQTFNLNKSLYNEEALQVITNKIKVISDYLNNYANMKSYFERMKLIITSEEGKLSVDKLISDYDVVIKFLKIEYENQNKIKNILLIDKRLTEIINTSINCSIALLGSKEKTYKEREITLKNELDKLKVNLKLNIANDVLKDRIDLSFPFENIKVELEKNSNEYARLTFGITDEDIKDMCIIDSGLFNLSGIKTKLSECGTRNINFFDDLQVKKLAEDLHSIGINLSSILYSADLIPKKVELYLSEFDDWRLIDNINKGDIAKRSIEYYFNKLVKDNQPDIILIDQPENDVDKTFISTTLSNFIKEQKVDKQIIVTSHDAIVAINSDVNKIIEAKITENNKIKYDSYDLEYVENEKLVATNRVSRILDGGKGNIKIRYQIYGGELNYENRNI